MQLRMLATRRRTSMVTTFPLLEPQPPPPSSFPSTFTFSPSGLSRGLFICHQPSVPSAAITCKNWFLPYLPRPAISPQPYRLLQSRHGSIILGQISLSEPWPFIVYHLDSSSLPSAPSLLDPLLAQLLNGKVCSEKVRGENLQIPASAT